MLPDTKTALILAGYSHPEQIEQLINKAGDITADRIKKVKEALDDEND